MQTNRFKVGISISLESIRLSFVRPTDVMRQLPSDLPHFSSDHFFFFFPLEWLKIWNIEPARDRQVQFSAQYNKAL